MGRGHTKITLDVKHFQRDLYQTLMPHPEALKVTIRQDEKALKKMQSEGDHGDPDLKLYRAKMSIDMGTTFSNRVTATMGHISAAADHISDTIKDEKAAMVSFLVNTTAELDLLK